MLLQLHNTINRSSLVRREEPSSHLVGLWERGSGRQSNKQPQKHQAFMGLRSIHIQPTTTQ